MCDRNKSDCEYSFFDCEAVNDTRRAAWLESSNVSSMCSPRSDYYQFGIFSDALTKEITSSSFFRKYFYSLWFGLKNLR